jgi:hypothetical protein
MPYEQDDTERAAALAWARFLLNRASVRVRAHEEADADAASVPAPDSRRPLGISDSH